MKISSLILFLFILQGCGNSNNLDTKERELDLKEKELLLKEKELLLKEKEKSISEKTKEVKPNVEVKKQEIPNQLSNIEDLIGEWWMLHNATEKIFFYRDGTVFFNVDDQKARYKLENGKITLYFNDKPKKIMKFYLERDNSFRLEDGVCQYMKSDPN